MRYFENSFKASHMDTDNVCRRPLYRLFIDLGCKTWDVTCVAKHIGVTANTYPCSLSVRQLLTLLKTAMTMIAKPTMSAMAKLTMNIKTKLVDRVLLLAN